MCEKFPIITKLFISQDYGGNIGIIRDSNDEEWINAIELANVIKERSLDDTLNPAIIHDEFSVVNFPKCVVVKIFSSDYYGCNIRILRDENGEEWINAIEFGNALEQNLFNKTVH